VPTGSFFIPVGKNDLYIDLFGNIAVEYIENNISLFFLPLLMVDDMSAC